MKKTMVIVAAILFSFAANAQRVHFGFKGGMNASELHGDDITDAKTKIGFHAGLLAHIHTNSPSWAIQPEVMYSLEGAKYDMGDAETNVNLHFVNVPILVQYMFGNGFRVEAGPQIGFLAGAKVKEAGGDNSIDVKDNFKSTNFSIPVGIGYLLSSGLGFDARYNFGISDMNDSGEGSKITGNNFQFGLFYQFTHSKK